MEAPPTGVVGAVAAVGDGYMRTTPQEDEAVEALRAQFADNDSVQSMSRLDLLRYVRARSTQVESVAILKSTITWRAETEPEKLRKAQFDQHFKSGLFFLHKHDKLGRPCVVAYGALHVPTETTTDITYKTVVYTLERLKQTLNERTAQYVMIYDMKDFSFMKNFDVEAIKKLAKLQDVYPELLGAAYLINAPWLVSTLMKLLYAVMTKQTMAKVKLLDGDGKQQLREYFDADCLLPEHGGTSDFKYEYNPGSDDEQGQNE